MLRGASVHPFFIVMTKEARTIIVILITFLMILIDMCNVQQSIPDEPKKEIEKDSSENKKMVNYLYV